jgi:hypothetical protein
MPSNDDLVEQVQSLQNLLILHATGNVVDEKEYRAIRDALLRVPFVREQLPRLVRTNRGLPLFLHFQRISPTYKGRREYIWDEFAPLIAALETQNVAPSDGRVTEALAVLTSAAVQGAWQTALERRASDPDGAITSARTLLETVCKHILDNADVAYDGDSDLPKLYKLTAETLELAPSQQTEPIFRRIMGGCTSVVEGIGAMRNKLGDAHGVGEAHAHATSRHAALAVNLAGAAATFLVETWEEQRTHSPE